MIGQFWEGMKIYIGDRKVVGFALGEIMNPKVYLGDMELNLVSLYETLFRLDVRKLPINQYEKKEVREIENETVTAISLFQ